MVYDDVYVMFSFNDEIFNFGIDNVIEKPIIHEGLFYIFKFVKKDSSKGG